MNTETIHERNRRILVDYKLKAQAELIRRDVWQCCLNCMNWNKGIQRCDYYVAVPPPAIIVSGCAMHEMDDIPF